jgi:hypothetical protein
MVNKSLSISSTVVQSVEEIFDALSALSPLVPAANAALDCANECHILLVWRKGVEPPVTVCTDCEPTQFSPDRADVPTPATASSGFSSIHEKRNLMIHIDHALPRVACSHKTLPAGTWEQLYECAIVELDHAQLPGRILDARHAILDRAEEILTRPSCDEHRALNTAFRTLRTLEEVMAKEKSAA